MRQIFFDTETTGLEAENGDRIVEVGCVEMVNRQLTGRHLHLYLNPQRDMPEEAFKVHGLSAQFLSDKPLFADKADELMDFLAGAQLVIHNAAFDIGFINHELSLLGRPAVTELCSVLDTLQMARSKHPGQKNNLDALARRYFADNRDRTYHGALLDAEILADVYLAMTGGQVGLSLGHDEDADGAGGSAGQGIRRLPANRPALPGYGVADEELAAHEARLQILDKSAGGRCLFRDIHD